MVSCLANSFYVSVASLRAFAYGHRCVYDQQAYPQVKNILVLTRLCLGLYLHLHLYPSRKSSCTQTSSKHPSTTWGFSLTIPSRRDGPLCRVVTVSLSFTGTFQKGLIYHLIYLSPYLSSSMSITSTPDLNCRPTNCLRAFIAYGAISTPNPMYVSSLTAFITMLSCVGVGVL